MMKKALMMVLVLMFCSCFVSADLSTVVDMTNGRVFEGVKIISASPPMLPKANTDVQDLTLYGIFDAKIDSCLYMG